MTTHLSPEEEFFFRCFPELTIGCLEAGVTYEDLENYIESRRPPNLTPEETEIYEEALAGMYKSHLYEAYYMLTGKQVTFEPFRIQTA